MRSAGKCYHIYSRGQPMAMVERPKSEIQRTDLAPTCLNTCTLTDDSVETFLSRAMDPLKAEEDVSHSMRWLKKLGAIKASGGIESLTLLEQCLSRLPLDPAVGRMLVLGVVLQCPDPILTAAACLNSRHLCHWDKEKSSRRQSFSEYSDLMAEVEVYHDFQQIWLMRVGLLLDSLQQKTS
jgi:ATP-dependent RNA helicase DHX36